MIIFRLEFAVHSRSQGGHGRLAWRSWVMIRRFNHGELPRLPAIGSLWDISGLGSVRCTAGYDRLGNFNPEGGWDASLPLTEFHFGLGPPGGWINRLGCYAYTELTPPAKLIVNLQEAGFSVTIDHPLPTQELTETPPPKVSE